MVTQLVRLALLVAGIVHVLPLVGVLGAARLHALYGVAVADAQLLVLMRHRALMFGVFGFLLLAAVFAPALRDWMLPLAWLSTSGFVVLGMNEPLVNAMRRVMWVDAALAALLTVACIARVASDA